MKKKALELALITISSNALEMIRVSTGSIFTLIECKKIGKLTLHESFVPGKYIICIYDEKWYIALIHECSHENQDVLVQFMKRDGLFLYWFEDDHRNQCWLALQHIICNVEVPILHGSSSRKYTLSRNDLGNIKKLLPEKIVFD